MKKTNIDFAQFLLENFDMSEHPNGKLGWVVSGGNTVYSTDEAYAMFESSQVQHYAETPEMINKIIYVDMDGVIADYMSSYKKLYDPFSNKFPQNNWGMFSNLEPIEGAINAVKKLMEYYDVWILSKPSYKNPLCYTEKRVWIEKYFDLEFCKKLILCCDKGLVKGDYLIDDCIGDGQENFEGEHIHFGKEKFPDWEAVKQYLIPNE